MKVCRVLSIDGGGIRGVIPGTILSGLDKAVGGNIADRFHLIAGTSTGGILASALAHGLSPDAALKFYRDRGPAIFGSSALLGQFSGAKFEAGPLESALKAVFAETSLSQIKRDLLLTSYDLSARSAQVFKSWKARGVDTESAPADDFLVRDACRATSAAPTFFIPAKIKSAAGKEYALIDGGVYANNPATMAFVAARRLMPLADRYVVVSIGTGTATKPISYDDAVSWGLVGWAQPLLDVMFSGQEQVVNYEMDQLAPLVSHFRLQSSLAGASEAMDDASAENLAALAKCGERTLKEKVGPVKALADILRAPIDPALTLGYPPVTAPPRPKKIVLFPIKKLEAQVEATIKRHDTLAAPEAGKGPNPTGGLVGALLGAITGAAVGGPIGTLIGAGAGGAIGVAATAKERGKGE